MHSKKSTTFAPAIRKLHPQFGVWCNGNTADSGPAFPGSSPGTPTRRKASNIWKLFFLLNTSILGCIKAGTGLHGVQVVMAYDERGDSAVSVPGAAASEPVAVPKQEVRKKDTSFESLGVSSQLDVYNLLLCSPAVKSNGRHSVFQLPFL